MNIQHAKQTTTLDAQPLMDCAQNSSLRHLIQKAKRLLSIDREIKNLLPEGYEKYCHVMNLNQHTLILGVSNAAVATRIQLLSHQLVLDLHRKNKLTPIQKIQCKVCAETIRYVR